MSDPGSSRSSKIADLERQLDKAPSLRIRVELARLYHEEGQFQKAVDACALAVKENPTYVSARVLLGRIHFDMGSESEAREQMERVLGLAPDNLVARRVLARISEEQGDRQGALERYRALLAFSPDDKEVAAKIEELEAAPAPEAAAAAPQAEPGPAEAGTPEPTAGPEEGAGEADATALATPTLAEIYVQQGLVQKAIQVYREILAGDPGNAEARKRLDELKAPAEPPEDPRHALRQRKIEVLGAWLAAIRGVRRAHSAHGGETELD